MSARFSIRDTYEREIPNLFRDLTLRPLFPTGDEAKPTDHDFLFAFIQDVEIFIYFTFFNFQLNPIRDLVGFRPEDVDERDFVALFVRSDRIVQRHVLAGFLERPEMHQDFVLDAARRERRELRAFSRLVSDENKVLDWNR